MHIIFLFALLYHISIRSMEHTKYNQTETTDLDTLAINLQKLYKTNKDSYVKIIEHFYKKETSSNLTNVNLITNNYDVLNIIYSDCIQNRTYQDTRNVIHNASLQTIDQRVLNIKDDRTFYSSNPLKNGIIKNTDGSLVPIAHPSFNIFSVTDSPEQFLFKNLYDGPNANNIWVFAYQFKKDDNIQSLIKFIRIDNPSRTNAMIITPHFDGKICAMILHDRLSTIYFVRKMNNTFHLHIITFSIQKKVFSTTNCYNLPNTDAIKKICLLQSDIVLLLTKNGLLYKTEIDKKITSLINITNYLGSYIALKNIIKNQKIPYLWLLLSTTYELYMLNFKNKKEKIVFTKIADVSDAKEIWFDGDYILIEHKTTTLPIEIKIKDTIISQYSLHLLRIVLANKNALALLKDSNNVK